MDNEELRMTLPPGSRDALIVHSDAAMIPVIEPTLEGDFVLAEDEPFRLAAGVELCPVKLRYAIYGELNEQRDNAILVCHALSGSARVADWWPQLFVSEGNDVGVFDLNHHCI